VSNATATNAILGALAELNKAVSLLIVRWPDTVTASGLTVGGHPPHYLDRAYR
jgi:hypothetical protein